MQKIVFFVMSIAVGACGGSKHSSVDANLSCGNNTCESFEDCSVCPDDCGYCPGCGDGTCSNTETCSSCEPDCGSCSTCGDGECDPGEDCDLDCTNAACSQQFAPKARKLPRLAATQRPLDSIELLAMPSLDTAALRAAEFSQRSPGRAPRFAQPREVTLTPDQHGTWEELADGTRVWKLRVKSATAVSLNLGFRSFYMPEGANLHIYTPDRATVIGPFDVDDNESHGELWTPVLPGDELVLEVQLAQHVATDEIELELHRINHGYLDPFSNRQATDPGHSAFSGSCNVDVACSASDGYPEVDAWRKQIAAVGGVSSGGSIFCTGFLVNNARRDCAPYFMSADHCDLEFGTESLVIYWNYQNSTCRAPGTGSSGSFGDGSLSSFNTGARFLARYGQSDFSLVELDDPVAAPNAFFAGWDATGDTPQSGVCIHHPSGDEKRISFEDDRLVHDGDEIIVRDWDLGTTEGGSSGSPLFNENGRVVGQLYGGGAACGNNLSDRYGAFSRSWTGGGSSSSSLRPWLDPDNTGILTLGGQ